MEEIKASDIMIGNYFHVDGFPMYISGILNTTVYMDFNGNEAGEWEEYIKDLVPIPLTEDILLKAGFGIFEDGIISRKDLSHSELLQFSYSVNRKNIFCEVMGWRIECKYVHQAQNLFKSITGNDLNIEV